MSLSQFLGKQFIDVQPMEAHFDAGPGNVIIDSCEPCLLNWLDHGELTRIANAPDSLCEADADQ